MNKPRLLFLAIGALAVAGAWYFLLTGSLLSVIVQGIMLQVIGVGAILVAIKVKDDSWVQKDEDL